MYYITTTRMILVLIYSTIFFLQIPFRGITSSFPFRGRMNPVVFFFLFLETVRDPRGNEFIFVLSLFLASLEFSMKNFFHILLLSIIIEIKQLLLQSSLLSFFVLHPDFYPPNPTVNGLKGEFCITKEFSCYSSSSHFFFLPFSCCCRSNRFPILNHECTFNCSRNFCYLLISHY